jgi:hypothetical protein
MMSRSTWKVATVRTLVLAGAGLLATSELRAQEADADCKVEGEGFKSETKDTEMVCAYRCRSTRDQKYGTGVVPPTYTCFWSGQNKTTPYLSNLIASNDPTNPSTNPNTTNNTNSSNTVSLVSPTKYTYSGKGKAANKKLAAKQKAFESGGYTKSETAKLKKLRKLDPTYDVGSRLDAMETQVSTMVGHPSYANLVKALKNVQELESVLARDGELSDKEAKKLNNRLMALEARVGVASGDGLQAKEALVRSRFRKNKKHLDATEIKEVKKQLSVFVANKKKAAESDNSISNEERASLLEMLQNTLVFIREKRDEKLSVELVATNCSKAITRNAEEGVITEAQKKKLLAEVAKAVKAYDGKNLSKAEALKAIRKAGGANLIDEAFENLDINS